MDKDNVLSGMVSELRRGTLVLSVLSQRKSAMYGYSLVNTLNEKGISAEANTLYPLLRRLENQGLLESSWQTDGPKPRKYYQATEFGNKICQQLKQHWDKTVNSINQIFEEEAK